MDKADLIQLLSKFQIALVLVLKRIKTKMKFHWDMAQVGSNLNVSFSFLSSSYFIFVWVEFFYNGIKLLSEGDFNTFEEAYCDINTKEAGSSGLKQPSRKLSGLFLIRKYQLTLLNDLSTDPASVRTWMI